MHFFQNNFSFLAASAISSSLEDEFAILVFAVAGGLLVFIGLVIEKWADFINDRFEGGEHPTHKKLENVGWAILMIGIAIEIGDAGFAAIDSWETRQLAIKNNPLNQPIKSIKADVFLTIRGDFNVFFLTNDFFSPKNTAQFSFSSLDRALIIFSAQECSVQRVQTGTNAPLKATPNSATFSMSFNWPNSSSGNDFIFTNSPYWISRSNVSMDILDKEIKVAEIAAPCFIRGAEILWGSCVVTFNGSIQRKFALPKYTDNGSIRCQPMTNSP